MASLLDQCGYPVPRVGALAVMLGRSREVFRIESLKVDIEQETEEGLAPAVVYDQEVAGKVTPPSLRERLSKWTHQ